MRRHTWLALLCVLTSATITAAQSALPAGAAAQLGVHRLRVPAPILDSAFSSDGRTFVVAFQSDKDEPSVILFDVATGRERKRLNIRNANCVATARHKPLMAVATNKGFELWDLAAEKRVQEWPYPAVTNDVVALAISPDGAQVVAAALEPSKAVLLRWDATTGKALPTLVPQSYPTIVAVTFSGDGSKFLTATLATVAGPERNPTISGGAFVVWDAKTGAKLADFGNAMDATGGTGAFAVFAPDGKTVARGIAGNKIEIIDLDTRKTIADIPAVHTRSMFTPDSKQLIIFSMGAGIVLWDIAANKKIRVFEASSDQAQALRPQLSPDGKRLALVGTDLWYHGGANYVLHWDTTTGKRLQYSTGHPGTVNGMAYSPDGRLLATISSETILIFDPKTGDELRRWVGHKSSIEQIAFSPDGNLLASASVDATVALWDPATGKEHRPLTAGNSVKSIAFTRDGATLIAVSTDQRVQIWDVAKGKPLHHYGLQRAGVATLSPTGDQLAWGRGDGTFRQQGTLLIRQQARTGKSLPHLDLRLAPDVNGLETTVPHTFAFSPDSRMIATSDSLELFNLRASIGNHTVRVWETATQREIVRYANNNVGTRLLAISPDGRILAHGDGRREKWGFGGDRTLVFRDLAAAQSIGLDPNAERLSERDPIEPIFSDGEAHQGNITCLTFSPDSKFLATGGADQVVYIWRVEHFFKRPARPEFKGNVADLWPHLADVDAGKAYRAIAYLERKPTETLALLRKHVHPVPSADAKAIARHVRDLASANFAVRQQAYVALEKAGEPAAHLLQEATRNAANLEMKRRLEALLEKLDRPLDESSNLRFHRSLVLLERIGTPEARQFLTELSQGAPLAWLTTEARHWLRRCDER